MRAGAALALAAVLAASGAVAGASDNNGQLRVMTFNLRFASSTPPNSWAERRPLMSELFKLYAPDLVGTQEGVYTQLGDIAADLPALDWIGLGRDGGSRGEFMAIFYRRDRLAPLEFNHFWLSATPATIGSRSFGNRLPRMVTWVRFRDLRTGCEFYAINTHLDHLSQSSQEKSADLLLEAVNGFEAALPILMLGDFNAEAGSNPVHDRLTAGGTFFDIWSTLHRSEPPFGTYHDFKGPAGADGRGRIDWILARGSVRPRSIEILTFMRDGRYPSDHFPVMARIEFERCR